jgi:phosphatidylserine/phosphatidylglycerophosphate/cardiolipin synthase-like enzyme
MTVVSLLTRGQSKAIWWKSAVVLLAIGVFVLGPAGVSAGGSTELTVLTEPNAGMTPIYRILASAQRAVDLTMYELSDRTLEGILVADAARGVKVRVLLDQRYEESANTPAFTDLSHHGVAVRWAPSRYNLTHEKAAVIDGRSALVMTLNFTSEYYGTSRDFAVLDTTPSDVVAIETVFNHDWTNAPVVPSNGSDLVWSPGAEGALVGMIDSARHTLLVENEEMDDPYITTPLEAAARRGVTVEIVMTDSTEWSSSFAQLARAGVRVRTFAPGSAIYIHAKVIVADLGEADRESFVGSQNFSISSLVDNRELGIISNAPGLAHALATAVQADFAAASPWS